MIIAQEHGLGFVTFALSRCDAHIQGKAVHAVSLSFLERDPDLWESAKAALHLEHVETYPDMGLAFYRPTQFNMPRNSVVWITDNGLVED